MTTLSLTTTNFNSLPLVFKLDLISLCLKLIEIEGFKLIIDEVIIKDRDDFFDWQIKNKITFR